MPRKPDVQRHEGAYVEVFVYSRESLGLHLGDLRELVDRAAGVPDNVLVEFQGIEPSNVYVGEHRAMRARVRSKQDNASGVSTDG